MGSRTWCACVLIIAALVYVDAVLLSFVKEKYNVTDTTTNETTTQTGLVAWLSSKSGLPYPDDYLNNFVMKITPYLPYHTGWQIDYEILLPPSSYGSTPPEIVDMHLSYTPSTDYVQSVPCGPNGYLLTNSSRPILSCFLWALDRKRPISSWCDLTFDEWQSLASYEQDDFESTESCVPPDQKPVLYTGWELARDCQEWSTRPRSHGRARDPSGPSAEAG
jgi:hypothetical protein